MDQQTASGVVNLRAVERMLPARERLPLAARLQRELRRRIIDGVYRAHMYLPSERDLAKDFRTSRVTVANALHALEHDRLVLRTPGRGTRVLPVLERLSQPRIGIIHGD